MGMDPGLTDVFARYAADELFDEIDEVHVRDGGDLDIEGYAFAPVFSIWTTIEECLNPPLIWERGRGLYTSPSRSRRPSRSSSPRASARSSASTSSTRRSCSCRAASTAAR